MIKQSLFLLSLLAFVLRPGALRAEEVARLKSAQGSVESKPAAAAQWVSAQTGQAFQPQDALRTLQNSRAGILFLDGILVRLTVNIDENQVVIAVLDGEVTCSNEQGSVQVAGKKEGVRLFALLCEPLASESVRLWEEALAAFRKKEWDLAAKKFSEAGQKETLFKKASGIYLEQIKNLQKTPP